MKILYCAGIDLSLPQGHAVHVRRLTEALERRGHHVRIVARAASAPMVWTGPRGGLELVPTRGLRFGRHWSAERATATRLRASLQEFRPDLLLIRAEAFTLAPLWLERTSLPWVVECNSALAPFARVMGSARLRAALIDRAEGALLRRADAVGAVSGRLVERIHRHHGISRDRIHLVPNGAWVPPLGEHAGSPGAMSRPTVRFDFGFAGNLNQVQGLDLFVRGLQQALREPDGAPARLLVIGQSAYRPVLERTCVRLGLGEHVLFLGGMSEEEAIARLRSAHAVVAPYRVEPYRACGLDSLKVLQGLATDRPVLASAAPDLEGVAGNAALRVVSEESPEAWAGVIREITAEWSRAGRPTRDWPWPEGQGPGLRWVREHRTWDQTAEAWEAVFASARRARGVPGTVEPTTSSARRSR